METVHAFKRAELDAVEKYRRHATRALTEAFGGAQSPCRRMLGDVQCRLLGSRNPATLPLGFGLLEVVRLRGSHSRLEFSTRHLGWQRRHRRCSRRWQRSAGSLLVRRPLPKCQRLIRAQAAAVARTRSRVAGAPRQGTGNSTKPPSPRMDPAERPTDPGRRNQEGSKGGIKKEPNAQVLCRKKPRFFSDDRQTPARREARNHRSEDAKMLGPPPCGHQRTGRADQRDARGDANQDRSTPTHRRPVLLCATQRPRSTNDETTTTTRHRELRDPRPTHLTVDLGDGRGSLIERR